MGGRPSAWPTDALVVEVLAQAGPRIVGLRCEGSAANLLAETPDIGWETASGRYELFGGHRLWIAPEDAQRVAVPDSDGLAVEGLDDGLRLTGAADPLTGCVRSIEVRLDPVLPSMTVLHRLHNGGARPLELAIWPITQLPLGGLALLPQRRAIGRARHTPEPEPRPVAVLVVGRSPAPRPRRAGGRGRRPGHRAQGRLPRRHRLGRLRPRRDRDRAPLRAGARRAAPGSGLQRRGLLRAVVPRARGPRTDPDAAAGRLDDPARTAGKSGRSRPAAPSRRGTPWRLPIDGLAA